MLRLIENFLLAKAPTTEAIAFDMLGSCCCVVLAVVLQRFWRFSSSSAEN